MRRRFQNGLTQLIVEQPTISLFDVLIHPELFATVQGEAIDLIEYLNSYDPNYPNARRLDTLFEWALSQTPNSDILSFRYGTDQQREKLQKFRLFQVNHNASMILGYHSRAIWRLIEASHQDGTSRSLHSRLLHFLDEPLSCDSVFAGHFQRIIECFFFASNRVEDWFTPSDLTKLIEFCIDHADLLAYQQLLSHLIIDFPLILEIKYSKLNFLKLILQSTVKNTVHVYQSSAKFPIQERKEMAASLRKTQQQFFLEFEREPAEHAPLNWKGDRIPCAHWLFNNRLDSYEPSNALPRHIETRLRAFGLDPTEISAQYIPDVESMKLKAYLLLTSISMMILDCPEIIKEIQAEVDGEFPLIELLLLCGVLADPVSMVSTQAFRILKTSLYGIDWVEGEETESIDGIWTQEKVLQLVDDYAEDFKFAELLTPQMVAAFPIFWDHKYDNLTDQKSPLPPVTIPFIPPYDDLQELPAPVCDKHSHPNVADLFAPRPYQHERTLAITPLEKFGSHLLDEPPLCDAFNFQIMNAPKLGSKRADELRNQEPNDWYKCQEAVIKEDLILFDFLRTPVLHSEDRVSLLRKLELTFLYDPLDKRHLIDKSKPMPHVSLNGFVLELGQFVIGSDAFWFHDCLLQLRELSERISEPCLSKVLQYIDDLAEDFWDRTETNTQPSEQEKRLMPRPRSPSAEAQEKLLPRGLPLNPAFP